MRDLSFKIEADFVPLVVAPTLTLKLNITNADVRALIRSNKLRRPMRFEVTRPHLRAEEQGRFRDLLGEPSWLKDKLRSLKAWDGDQLHTRN